MDFFNIPNNMLLHINSYLDGYGTLKLKMLSKDINTTLKTVSCKKPLFYKEDNKYYLFIPNYKKPDILNRYILKNDNLSCTKKINGSLYRFYKKIYNINDEVFYFINFKDIFDNYKSIIVSLETSNYIRSVYIDYLSLKNKKEKKPEEKKPAKPIIFKINGNAQITNPWKALKIEIKN